jgi:hypothetical protein
MARPALDDDDDKPLDPAVEKVRRKLVRFVAINLGLLFVAVMAVVGAVVYKSRLAETPVATAPASEIPTPAGAPMREGEIALPAGAAVLTHAMSGSRISFDVALVDGSRAVYVYDMAEGRIVGRFGISFK